MIEFDFAPENVVNKTYTKTGGGRKGQDWSGLKFRMTASNRKNAEGVKERSVTAQFTISDKTFEALGLEEKGLIQYGAQGKTLLLVVPEEHAMFLGGRTKKDGTRLSKGSNFKNVMMENDLVEEGLISRDEDLIGKNQYLELEEVKVNGVPDFVEATYLVVASDEQDSDDSDDSDDSNSAPASESQEFADSQDF